MCQPFQSDGLIEAVYLIRVSASVRDHAAQAHCVVLGFCLDRCCDPVHGKNLIKVIGGNHQGSLGMLKR